MKKLLLGSVVALLLMGGPAATCIYHRVPFSEGARISIHRTLLMCRRQRWVKTAERCWERDSAQTTPRQEVGQRPPGALAATQINVTASDAAAAREASPPLTLPVYNLDDIRIDMQRTACFGSCPVYSVSIEGTGKVIYNGVQNVAEQGMRQTTLPDNKLVALVNEFLRLWFFDAKERYAAQEHIALRDGRKYVIMGSAVTDLPSTVLSLKLADRQKTVTLCYNYPPELRELAAKIDEVTGVLKWVGSKDSRR